MDLTDRSPSVIVGVDGSDLADTAAVLAVEEAHRRLLAVRLVTAFNWSDDLPVAAPHPGRAAARQAAADHLEQLQRDLRARFPGIQVEGVVLDGPAADVLLTQSAHAELLVLGAHGPGPLAAVLGPVRAPVLRHCLRPVLLAAAVRDHPAPSAPVVVAVDDAPEDWGRLLRSALLAATTRSAALVVLDLRQPGPHRTGTDAGLDALVERLQDTCPGVRTRVEPPTGPRTLPEQPVAHGAQLLVVGRGRPTEPLGSTARAALTQSQVPVLVVPTTPEAQPHGPVRALARTGASPC